jgi:putative peptidoglycan lipid II flippase
VCMRPLAHGGLALATALASILNLLLLLTALHRRLGGLNWRAMALSLGRSLLSAGLMAPGVLGVARVMIHGAGQTTASLALGVAASVAAGVVIYLVASLAIGSPEMHRMLNARRGSFRGR